MSFANVMLPILIVLTMVGFGVWIYYIQKKMKKEPITTKPILNYLHNFSGGHLTGKLVGKPQPAGNKKQLLKLTYASTEYDVFENEPKLVYNTVVVHKDFMIAKPDILKILPKNESDIDMDDPYTTEVKKYICQNRDYNTIVSAVENQEKKLADTLKNNLGGQFYAPIIDSLKEQNKDLFETFVKKDEKGDKK